MFTRNIVQTKEFWVPGLSSALLQEPEDKSRRDWSHWKGSALVPQFSLWNEEFHETRECCIGLEGKTKNRFSNIIRFSFQWEDFVLLPTFHFLPCLSLPSREGIAFQPKPSTTLVFKVSLLLRWEKKKISNLLDVALFLPRLVLLLPSLILNIQHVLKWLPNLVNFSWFRFNLI